jgi:type II secretory ATPase GspE/PulE/Tfp pilus assembly ATPase PilB-like protein
MGLHELMEADSELQRLIMANPTRDELAECIKEHKIKTLFDDGLARVLERNTTIEEVSRVVNW